MSRFARVVSIGRRLMSGREEVYYRYPPLFGVCIFILHLTAQPGPDKLSLLCYSYYVSSLWCVCVEEGFFFSMRSLL